jgi:hypothetical protein
MKSLILVLLCLISTSAFAVGKDPVFPWPFDVPRCQMDAEDIAGKWVAYDHGVTWFVTFASPSLTNRPSLIVVVPNGDHNHQKQGVLLNLESTYFGQVALSSKNSMYVFVYQTGDGLKLRVAESENDYYDLRLYPLK